MCHRFLIYRTGTCGDGYSEWWATGAMTKPYCEELPLYGDAVLLIVYAVACTVFSLVLLVWSERKLRRKLAEAIDITVKALPQQHRARHESLLSASSIGSGGSRGSGRGRQYESEYVELRPLLGSMSVPSSGELLSSGAARGGKLLHQSSKDTALLDASIEVLDQPSHRGSQGGKYGTTVPSSSSPQEEDEEEAEQKQRKSDRAAPEPEEGWMVEELNPATGRGFNGAQFKSQMVTRAVQLRYDYLSMLSEQGRSFCGWIVNKTWWDVTLNVLKFLQVDHAYYSVAIFFTFVATAVPLCLYDTTLLREVLCTRGGLCRPLKQGILSRSLSDEGRYQSVEAGEEAADGESLAELRRRNLELQATVRRLQRRLGEYDSNATSVVHAGVA